MGHRRNVGEPVAFAPEAALEAFGIDAVGLILLEIVSDLVSAILDNSRSKL